MQTLHLIALAVGYATLTLAWMALFFLAGRWTVSKLSPAAPAAHTAAATPTRPLVVATVVEPAEDADLADAVAHMTRGRDYVVSAEAEARRTLPVCWTSRKNSSAERKSFKS